MNSPDRRKKLHQLISTFIPSAKHLHVINILMFNPFSEAFTIRVKCGEFEQNINGMFPNIVGNDLFFFMYRKIRNGRCSNIIIYMKQLLSLFGSSMLGASFLRDESKETSLGLSNFFLDGGILKIHLS